MTKYSRAQTTPAGSLTAGNRKVALVLHVTTAFLYFVALYLYMPTLPTYVQSKTDSLALVGLVLSMYGLWQAIIRLPVGIAADWVGWRKPFILVGLSLAGLGAWLMGSAPTVQGVLVGRIVTGLAAGTWVPLVVLFSSLFPPEEAVRASAMLTLVGSLGRLVATSATGWLNGLGGYALAFTLAAVMAMLAMAVLWPAREARRPPQRPSLGGLGRLISRRDVLLPSLLSAVAQYANWAATFGFLPILAKQLGASDVLQSLLVSLNLAVMTGGNFLATALARRIGAQRLAYVSFIFLAAGIGSVAALPVLPTLFVAQFCIGLSQGIGYPVLMGMSIRYVDDAERTTAMGLHQAVYALGMFGGPALSGVLASALGIRSMFGVTALVALVVGLFGTYWLREQKARVLAASR